MEPRGPLQASKVLFQEVKLWWAGTLLQAMIMGEREKETVVIAMEVRPER